jgi:hypothetical protein
MRRRDPIVILYPRIESTDRSSSCRVHLIYSMRARRVRIRTYLASTSLSTKHVVVERRGVRPSHASVDDDGTGGRVSRLALCFNARYTCFNREVGGRASTLRRPRSMSFLI